MSVFDNTEKDNLEFEIRTFLENHTIADLMEVVAWCIDGKEIDYIDKCTKGE